MPVVVNQIADEIYTRLLPLDGDSSGSVTMSIVRPNARGVSPVHGQISIGYGSNIEAEEWHAPGNPFREGRQQTFLVTVRIRDESASTQITEDALEIYGQVKYKLCENGTSDWYTMGGLACDSKVGDIEPIEPNGGLGGVIIPVLVQYRTNEAAVDIVG